MRSSRLSPRAGPLAAAATLAAGLLVAAGLLGAPGLIADLGRSADVLALRDMKERGLEAFASVRRRRERLEARVAADELFLARVGVATEVPPPEGLPGDPPATPPPGAPEGEVEAATNNLGRRLFRLETFRRRLATATAGLDAASVPSISPVEPSAAVPVAVFGRRVSPLTGARETFLGLDLAVPAGTRVLAPAAGVVTFAGSVAAPRADAPWRRLGTVVVLAHDSQHYTVFGHLERAEVKRKQRLRRGETIGRAGQTGFAARPQLHYEVRRVAAGRARPMDPRLFVLDAEWITAKEVRAATPSGDLDAGDDLPEFLK